MKDTLEATALWLVRKTTQSATFETSQSQKHYYNYMMAHQTTKALLLTIYLLTLTTPVVSFVAYRRGVARVAMLAKRNENDNEGDLDNFRQLLERRFATFDGDREDPMRSFIRGEEGEPVNDPSSGMRALDKMFDANPLDDENFDQCEGEYCFLDSDAECKIPESFKIAPGKDAGDVMNFLGIKRAEPLKIKKDVGEWQ